MDLLDLLDLLLPYAGREASSGQDPWSLSRARQLRGARKSSSLRTTIGWGDKLTAIHRTLK